MKLRNILFFAVAASLSAAKTVSAQGCPPAEVLAPCECRDDYMDIRCSNVEEELKAIFDRVTPLIGQDVVFEKLTIHRHNAIELPANMTSLKFKEIYLNANYALGAIHPEAFNSTYDTTTVLSFRSNGLVSSEADRRLWIFLSKFKEADIVDLYGNQISYIPDDPFPEQMPKLKMLSFDYSFSIQKLGSRMLANLPNLEALHLLECGLENSAFYEDTFEGIAPTVTMDLAFNKFDVFPSGIFKSALDSGVSIRVGGQNCNPGGCWGQVRLHCNTEIYWLCQNADKYRNRLTGYVCWEDSHELWDWCRLQNDNNNSTLLEYNL